MLDMLQVKQRENESMADYIKRFSAEIINVNGFKDDVAQAAFLEGLAYCSFKRKMRRKAPATYAELIQKANVYVQADEWARGGEGVSAEKPRKEKQESPQQH